MLRLLTISLISYLVLVTQANAILTIEITGGTEEGTYSIAVIPFGFASGVLPPPQDIASIVSNDLHRSGRFSPMPNHVLPEQPFHAQQINFANWQKATIPYIVIGRVAESAEGYAIEFELFSTYTRKRILGLRYNATTQTLRQVAHQISDEIYQALMSERGIFSTRIVYVTVQNQGGQMQYQLYIADADGANPQLMLKSTEPIFSPTWSPRGDQLAYVTYDNLGRDKRMAVYIQEIRTGKRTRVSAKPGLNAAPAWSPDGKYLALTLSKDGNPEIYLIDLATLLPIRLTNNPAIDTEPEWTPDGKSLIFTSDRSGQPQIYRMAANGSNVQRLTYVGSYNARPRLSPDGTQLALLHNNGNGFQIAILNLKSNSLKILTRTTLDESPSFAPNGGIIIYATGTELAAVSTDGVVHQRLSVNMSEQVREPSWSPFFVNN
jgi:TolB protein